MQKDQIRRQMKEKRRALSKNQIQSASKTILEKLLQTDAYRQAQIVCFYLSAFHEVDTAALAARIKADGKLGAVPVTDADGQITLRENTGSYQTGAFGIREPVGTPIVSPQAVDLFVVPALAFDREKNRLGFGKGCYDRLLADARGIKIGIGYDFQLVDTLPCDAHDIKMDCILTEMQSIQ